MTTNYNNILKTHLIAGKALILWGSSGTGKTSIFINYAKQENLRLIIRSMSTIVPTELSMLIYNQETGQVVEKYADWVQELLNKDGEPTLLFLDEITRPSSDKALSMLIPLISERMFNGKKIRDNVQVVGASNLSEEDHGVCELPDAVMKRCTHVAHRISFDEEVLVSKDLVKEIKIAAGMAAAPQNQGVFEIKDINCMRQRTDLSELLIAGKELLSYEDMLTVSIGRLGIEAGAIYAKAAKSVFDKDNKKSLPPVFTKKDTKQAIELQNSGDTIELTHYFAAQVEAKNKDAIMFICTESSPELFSNVLNITNGSFLSEILEDGYAAITYCGKHKKLSSILGGKG